MTKVPLEGPDGTSVRMQLPAWDFSDTPTAIRMLAPRLGQHGAKILAEVDYDGQEIAWLGNVGILA